MDYLTFPYFGLLNKFKILAIKDDAMNIFMYKAFS